MFIARPGGVGDRVLWMKYEVLLSRSERSGQQVASPVAAVAVLTVMREEGEKGHAHVVAAIHLHKHMQ